MFSPFQETSLVQMSEGLLLHHALLSSISTHLGPQDTVTELLTDTTDLLFHIRKVTDNTTLDRAVVFNLWVVSHKWLDP